MKIVIKHFGNQFNVGLATKEGLEPFVEMKGCSIKNGPNGEFVSWAATKKPDGTWWRHIYASEAFNAAVLAEAKKTAPAKPARQARPSRDDMDSDVPF